MPRGRHRDESREYEHKQDRDGPESPREGPFRGEFQDSSFTFTEFARPPNRLLSSVFTRILRGWVVTASLQTHPMIGRQVELVTVDEVVVVEVVVAVVVAVVVVMFEEVVA
jgi:hypothetical protein